MRRGMLAFWLLAGFAAYCFVWLGTATGYAELIEENIQVLNERHNDMEIRYAAVSKRGFPLGHTTIVEALEVQYGDYLLILGDVGFEFRHAEQKRFLITPQEATSFAKLNEQAPFEVKVSEYPIMSVRVGEKPEETARTFSEYAVGLPPKITLHIQQEGRGERTIGFDLPSIQMPAWRKIPDRPQHAVELFVLMLDEAFLRPQ